MRNIVKYLTVMVLFAAATLSLLAHTARCPAESTMMKCALK